MRPHFTTTSRKSSFAAPDQIFLSAGTSVMASATWTGRFKPPARYCPSNRPAANKADVDVVLTGTLLRSGSQLRLTAQLLAASEGTLVWSKCLQVDLQKIFQLQDTLVSSVVESLALP